jgi:hypothetical protein
MDNLVKFSTSSFLSYEYRTKHPAAILYFAIFLALQLVALFSVVRYFFRTTWDQHLASGIWAIVLTCLVCNLVVCFGEYFFHRYLLHLETVRFLRTFTTSHRKHHKLTSIGFDDEQKTVRNAYSISSIAQDDQGTFPPWALVGAFAAFTPFFAPIAFSFPGIPILIGGYTSLAIALFLYETIHVAHHQPYETWWKPKMNSRIFGKVWRKLYGFHQAHHANYFCNMNIGGFLGVPVADLVFGTYSQLDELLLDGAPGTKDIARKLTPQPSWLIAWLDRVAFKRRRWMVKVN